MGPHHKRRHGFSDVQLHIKVRSLHARLGMTARLQADLPDDGQISARSDIAIVQPSFKKYFASPFGRNSFIDSPIPSLRRGGSRSSRTRGGMRWTRAVSKDVRCDADGEVVWFWHLDADAKFLRS
jgi:hypothetical protein